MFEKIKKQRRAIHFFTVTYLVFGGAFVYLLLLTPGLELVQEAQGNNIDVFLLNDSVHLINNIEIETLNGEKLLFVEKLLPGEKQLVPVKNKDGVVELAAKAPYHATVKKSFVFKLPGEEPKISLRYNITAPPLVFVDWVFAIEIETCNDSDFLSAVTMAEEHEAEFFKEVTSVETFSIRQDECKTISFSLTPAKSGETKILFNVKALSYSKQISKDIKIEE